MYRVYADDVLIHDGYAQDFEIHLKSPKLTIEENSAGSFSAIIPPYNPGYSIVTRMITTIFVKRDVGTNRSQQWQTIWSGRVISENMDMWNNRNINCEGALAYLNDTIQPIVTYNDAYLSSYISKLIKIHNDKVSESRKINVGIINAADSVGMYEYKTENNNTLTELKSNVFDRVEGHLRIRYDSNDKPYLDYLNDYPNTSAQEINFGENLLDFTKNWDLSNLVTYILPRGKQLDAEDNAGNKVYVTIETVNDGSQYLENKTTSSKYGRIEKVVDFNDAETPEYVKQLGEQYLAGGQFDEMSMEVSAIDLFRLMGSVPAFNLLDRVHCVSKPNGLDGFFPITKMDIQLDTTNGVKYTLGTSNSPTMSNSVTAGQSRLTKAINSIFDKTFKSLDSAKKQAADWINAAVTGYVTITGDDTSTQALVISELPNWENSQRYWRWNMHGLGFTKDGGERYELALTNDGQIVANAITAGILKDAQGYNYWNLETGAFRLSWSAAFEDGSTLKDIADTADDANNRKTGSANYLNGTSDWANWRFSGYWQKSTEREGEADCAKRNTQLNTDVLRSPDKSIRYASIKGYIMTLSFEGVSYDAWNPISSTNCLCVSFVLVNSNGTIIAKTDRAFSLDTSWSRRFCSIEMLDETFSTSTNTNSAYLEIWFTNKSTHKLTIRRVQFERGNVPTDWNYSETDTNLIAESYAKSSYKNAQDDLREAISKTEEYTVNQIKAYNLMINQDEIFKRLTNNGAAKGIYMEKNELYINASYIKTGSISADIVRTGIIQDRANNNSWNLETGYMKLNNIVLKSQTRRNYWGDYAYLTIDSGKLKWYAPSGELKASIGMTNDNIYRGLDIHVTGSVNIDNSLIISHDNKVVGYFGPEPGYNGWLTIRYVKEVDGNGCASYGETVMLYEYGRLMIVEQY